MTPEFIVIHHSLTEDGATVSWGAIRNWHMGRVPGSPYRMREIGYHAGVELVQGHYEVLLGRWWDEAGAHVKEGGFNRKSLGICLVGNFDLAGPPPAQWSLARHLSARLCRLFGVPVERVIGHREAGLMAGFDWTQGQFKTCPGRHFPLEDFRREVAAALAR